METYDAQTEAFQQSVMEQLQRQTAAVERIGDNSSWLVLLLAISVVLSAIGGVVLLVR